MSTSDFGNGKGHTSDDAFEDEFEGADEMEEHQLDLDDSDDSLPWLEDVDEFDESAGVSPIIRLILVLVVALLAVLALIYWFTREQPDPELLAEGSTIEAPEGDYKERPDDPGGKTFEGTGDSSFAVAEGQTREGRLAEPGFSSGEDAAVATDSEGVGVQVGAYQSSGSARDGWAALIGRYSELQGFKYRIVEGQADIGKVYRLQAVAADRAAANELCDKLKASGAACQVK